MKAAASFLVLLISVFLAKTAPSAAAATPPSDRELLDLYKEIVAHVEEHRHEEAFALAKKLEAEAREASDWLWTANALWRQAQYFDGRGETDQAIRIYREVREIHLRLKERNRLSIANELTLLSTLMSRFVNQGKLGEAFLAHREMEEALRSRYQKRGFGVVDLSDSNGEHFASRRFPSTLGRFLTDQAFFRENGGDIEGALEVARLAVQHFEQAERVTDWEQNSMASAHASLADLLTSTGRIDEAMEVWETLLAARTTYRAAQHFLSGQIARAHFRLLEGDEPEALFATVHDALTELEERRDLARALTEYGTLARMHAHQERPNEALAILETAVNRAREFNQKTPLARLLVVRAEILLADSQYDRVKADLAEALGYFRANGLLKHEVAAFAVFGRYLAETEQHDRAATFFAAANFLAGKFKGTNDASRLLEAITALRNRSENPENESSKTPAPDLQPLEMTTRVAAGELARGRFLLVNPGDETVEGELTVAGPVEADVWNPDRRIWAISIGDQANREKVTREFILNPGEKVVVFTETASAALEEQTVELRWSGPEELSAWRHFSRTETTADVAVVNANLALESPFYAVPLYHEIYYRGEAPMHLQNLRVTASARCRIVLSDEINNRILAIDAHGDGNFLGTGDVLFHDADGDGFPDVAIDAATGLAALEILVFPLETPAEEESLSVEIQLLTADGNWEHEETNILILHR